MLPVPPAKKPAPGALLDAVVDSDTLAVRNLIQQGADVNERDSQGNTPLSRAASYGYLEVVRTLLDKGANVDSRNTRGETALMLASASYRSNNEPIIRLLLTKGANMDIKNNDGDTALTLARKRDRQSIVGILKEETTNRKRIAEEFARAAEQKRRDALAEKQQHVRDAAKSRPKLGFKPPQAA